MMLIMLKLVAIFATVAANAIELPNVTKGALSMCTHASEFDDYPWSAMEIPGLSDMASGRPTYAHTIFNSRYLPGLAVDGNTDTLYQSHRSQSKHWWAVDLGSRMSIQSVAITPFSTNLKSFTMGAMDSQPTSDHSPSSYDLCYQHTGPTTSDTRAVYTCQGNTQGRYLVIYVEESANTHLLLREVNVYAGWTDLARGKPAYASSTHSGYPPSKAVDGDEGTLYHSNQQSNNLWWAVDLGAAVDIREVAIIANSGTYLQNFRIGAMSNEPPSNLPTNAYTLCHSHAGQSAEGRIIYRCNPNTRGRFLVIHVANTPGYIVIKEVNVYPYVDNITSVDVAKGKSAFSSSTSGSSHAPSKALDGNLATYFHTKEVDANPWWAVHLGSRMNIEAVVITNYQGPWLYDFVIGVMDTTPPDLLFPGAYKLCNKHVGDVQPGAKYIFRCQNNVRGRYVVVHMPGRRGKLILPEVQVFVYPEQKGNVAVGRPVWASSHYKNVNNAAVAVNGDRSNNGTLSQCSQTRMEVDPWWAVDLGMICQIQQVIITSRADCCEYRLSNFVVGITNENPLETPPRPGMYDICKFHMGPVSLGSNTTLKCDAIFEGRYLVVQIPGQDKVLELCEVEVYKWLAI